MRRIQLVSISLLLFQISPAQHKMESKDDKHHHWVPSEETAVIVFYFIRT
jgi:hypothetical protein